MDCKERSEKVMEVIDLASHGHTSFNITSLQTIINSVEVGTYKIFKDRSGGKVGYVVWADVSEESFLLFTSSGIYPRFKYEWEDGEFCIIFDLFFKDQKNILLREEIKEVFKNRKHISYARKGRISTLFNAGSHWSRCFSK